MYDILLTALIPLLLLFVALWQGKKSKDDKFFFSKNYTNTLKGLCAVTVILVHVPSQYQNVLQDAIGSFAFIAVTLFFFISAYGMQFSAEKKQGYLKHFWKNRLTSLLIPCVIINLFTFICKVSILNDLNLMSLIQINSYVKILLEYCLLFYVVMLTKSVFNLKNFWITDTLLIIGIVGSSLYLYLTKNHEAFSAQLGWCYERYGLLWGLLLYRFFPRCLKWLNSNRLKKLVFFMIISLILGLAYLRFKNEWFYGEYLLKIILGIFVIVFVFLISQRRTFFNRMNQFLGGISFEIYLSHGFVMGILVHFFPTLRSGLFLILTVIITIFFSFIAHIIAKRIINVVRVQ